MFFLFLKKKLQPLSKKYNSRKASFSELRQFSVQQGYFRLFFYFQREKELVEDISSSKYLSII